MRGQDVVGWTIVCMLYLLGHVIELLCLYGGGGKRPFALVSSPGVACLVVAGEFCVLSKAYEVLLDGQWFLSSALLMGVFCRCAIYNIA